MKNIITDNMASVAPLLLFFLVLGIIGLLYGIFDTIMNVVINTDTTMNLLMGRAWAFCIVIIFIILISWLLMRGQKSEYYPSYPGGRL